MKTISVHKSGVIYCAVTIAVSIMAIYGGNNFHYLAGAAAMGYLAASGVAGYRNVKNAEVSFSFPDEIYARTPFLLKVSVRGKTRAPAFLISVAIGSSRAFFPVVPRGQTLSRTMQMELPSRGIRGIEGIELSSTYPFDFFTRYWPVKFKGLVTVFPEPRPAGYDDAGNWVWSGGEDGARQKLDAEREIVGVRPYAEGDPMRMIHWKSTAKTGRVNSRLYDDSGDREAKMIDLGALLMKDKESGLSIAAYEISRAILSGRSIGMTNGDAVWPPSGGRADKLSMLAVLAAYE